MKKYLVLSLAFLFLSPMLVQAQSSDKTQEIKETIGWLNQVGLKMLKIPNPEITDDVYIITSLDKNGYIYFKKHYIDNEYEENSSVDTHKYNNLIQLTIYPNNSILSEWERGQSVNDTTIESTHYDFRFNSQEDARRVFNALSHLFTILEDDFILDDRVVDKNKF